MPVATMVNVPAGQASTSNTWLVKWPAAFVVAVASNSPFIVMSISSFGPKFVQWPANHRRHRRCSGSALAKVRERPWACRWAAWWLWASAWLSAPTQRLDGHRHGAIGRGAVAKLTAGIWAPAPDGCIGENGAGVAGAGADERGVGDSRDLHGYVAARGRAVAKLTGDRLRPSTRWHQRRARTRGSRRLRPPLPR